MSTITATIRSDFPESWIWESLDDTGYAFLYVKCAIFVEYILFIVLVPLRDLNITHKRLHQSDILSNRS